MATEDPDPPQGVRPRDHRPVDEEDRRDGAAHPGHRPGPDPAADGEAPLHGDPLAAQGQGLAASTSRCASTSACSTSSSRRPRRRLAPAPRAARRRRHRDQDPDGLIAAALAASAERRTGECPYGHSPVRVLGSDRRGHERRADGARADGVPRQRQALDGGGQHRLRQLNARRRWWRPTSPAPAIVPGTTATPWRAATATKRSASTSPRSTQSPRPPSGCAPTPRRQGPAHHGAERLPPAVEVGPPPGQPRVVDAVEQLGRQHLRRHRRGEVVGRLGRRQAR